jgi:glycosyltransferase involved in cell wall biosynthesis
VAVLCRGCGEQGSVAHVALRQARELAPGFDVTLLSDSFPADLPEGVRGRRIRARRFDALRRFAHVPNELSFALRCRSELGSLHRERRVDLVLSHAHAPAALAGAPLRSRERVPLALVTHGDIFDRPKGTYDARLTRFYEWVTPRAYRSADLVVALSRHMAALAASRGARADAIEVIPNGVEPSDLGDTGAEESGERDRFSVLFVGRLSVEKGPEVLLRACALAKADGLRLELRLVGDGPQRQELERLASSLGLMAETSFEGRVPQSTLGRRYRAAGAVCIPSLSDPFPGVVLEALGSGGAVVASRVGGIPDVIDSGTNGVLVPAGSAEELARALTGLARDPAAANRLRRSARSSVAERYSWTAVGAALSRAIRERLSTESPR